MNNPIDKYGFNEKSLIAALLLAVNTKATVTPKSNKNALKIRKPREFKNTIMDIITKSSNAVRKASKYLKSEISNWIRKHNKKKEVFLENFSVWFEDVFLSQFEINPYETKEYGEFIYNSSEYSKGTGLFETSYTSKPYGSQVYVYVEDATQEQEVDLFPQW